MENGVEQKVDTFQEAVTPVSIVLAIDESGSMKPVAAGVQDAARSFVRAVRPEDKLAMITFADRSSFEHDLSTERSWSFLAIDAYQPSGGTSLFDAVTDALLRLKTVTGRKTVVVMTDGRDENNAGTAPGSRRTMDDALEQLRLTDATIFAIGLGPKVDRAVLERLAEESGGNGVLPAGRDGLAGGLRPDRRDLAPPLRHQLHIDRLDAQRRLAPRRDWLPASGRDSDEPRRLFCAGTMSTIRWSRAATTGREALRPAPGRSPRVAPTRRRIASSASSSWGGACSPRRRSSGSGSTPTSPSSHWVVSLLLRAYFAYSILAVLVTFWRGPVRLPISSHITDLFVFLILMLLTDGPASPFFVYFMFSLITATLRWQWRGTLWTGVFVLAIYAAMALPPVKGAPDFELHRAFIRGVYLGVAALLIGYLGAYQERLQSDLATLAAWPRSAPRDLETAAREILEQATAIARAGRAVLIWEEKEEPWVHLAEQTPAGFRLTREGPDAFDALLAPAMGDATFLSENAAAANPTVMVDSTSSAIRQIGSPVGPMFKTRFAVVAVLSAPVTSDDFRGRLFLLDVSQMTIDDLRVADILGRHASAHLNQFYLLQRLRETAAQAERVRLARDLHDGILQSLTASALQLEMAAQLIDRDPSEARTRLGEIARIIEAEQAELRSFITELRPKPRAQPAAPAIDRAFLSRVRQLTHRLSQQWRIHIDLIVEPLASEPTGRVARELYRLLHEAIVNAARHARASAVRVELGGGGDRFSMSVTDNGTGFPFKGRYDLPALLRAEYGPATLIERTAGLGGELVVESTDYGSKLEFVVPMALAEDVTSDSPLKVTN